MLILLPTWMHLKNIILNGRSQTEDNMTYDFTYMKHSEKTD